MAKWPVSQAEFYGNFQKKMEVDIQCSERCPVSAESQHVPGPHSNPEQQRKDQRPLFTSTDRFWKLPRGVGNISDYGNQFSRNKLAAWILKLRLQNGKPSFCHRKIITWKHPQSPGWPDGSPRSSEAAFTLLWGPGLYQALGCAEAHGWVNKGIQVLAIQGQGPSVTQSDAPASVCHALHSLSISLWWLHGSGRAAESHMSFGTRTAGTEKNKGEQVKWGKNERNKVTKQKNNESWGKWRENWWNNISTLKKPSK